VKHIILVVMITLICSCTINPSIEQPVTDPIGGFNITINENEEAIFTGVDWEAAHIGLPEGVINTYYGEPDKIITPRTPLIDRVYVYPCKSINVKDDSIISFSEKDGDNYIGHPESILIQCYGTPDKILPSRSHNVDRVYVYIGLSFYVFEGKVVGFDPNG
jgi:hypothetical protein